MVFGGLFKRRVARPAPPLTDDGTLVIVGACFDPAVADSAVVARMREDGVDVEDGPFVMRHIVTLPDDAAVAEAERILAPDGWAVAVVAVVAGDAGARRVHVSREQRVAGREPARERTRMAGLAQRLGGDALGYEILARP